MEFDIERLREIQVYAYVVVTGLLVVVFYAYIYHIYNSDKKGLTNYEINAKLALDDALDSTPINGILKTKNGVNNELVK